MHHLIDVNLGEDVGSLSFLNIQQMKYIAVTLSAQIFFGGFFPSSE
jgi:hypothetical protein